jgi:photosystem II stability/assembly factor-like uncharacterized protein
MRSAMVARCFLQRLALLLTVTAGCSFTLLDRAGRTSSLPADAPKLRPGVWTNISPSSEGISFVPGGNLTQGMALDRAHPAVLYLTVCAEGASAAYPKGIYRSGNAGASWTRILEVDSPNHVRVSPTDALRLYVTDGVTGGTNGLWRTRDGAKTWQHISNMCDAAGVGDDCGMNDLYDIAVDPSSFDHILISFHAPWDRTETKFKGAGILESWNGGDSWIVHPPGPDWGYGHSVHFLYWPDRGIGDAKTWLVGTQGTGRYRTDDGGNTWTHVSSVPIRHGGSTIYLSKAGSLLASGVNGLLQSVDNGAHFSFVETGFSSLGVIGDGTTLYAGGETIAVAPENQLRSWTTGANAPATRPWGGPFELTFDADNRIVYSASYQNGLWALKLQ